MPKYQGEKHVSNLKYAQKKGWKCLKIEAKEIEQEVAVQWSLTHKTNHSKQKRQREVEETRNPKDTANQKAGMHKIHVKQKRKGRRKQKTDY